MNSEKPRSEQAASDVGFALFSFRFLSSPFIFAIRAYQVTLGPLMGGHCRFEPSCSRYAIEAYRVHGPLKGSWLTLRRLIRCHPLGGHGYDPVPVRKGRGGD